MEAEGGCGGMLDEEAGDNWGDEACEGGDGDAEAEECALMAGGGDVGEEGDGEGECGSDWGDGETEDGELG